jgi:hypothetical protein
MVLDVAGLGSAWAHPPAFSVYGDDDAGRESVAVTAAAVLVPIVDHPSGLTVIF